MKSIFTCIFISFALLSHSQATDCSKFKTGKFINMNEGKADTEIERGKKYQIEKSLDSGAEIKLKITWLSECSYRLTFVSGNKIWNEMQHVANNPDLIVKIVETGEDYYVQIAHFEGSPEFEYKSKIVISK